MSLDAADPLGIIGTPLDSTGVFELTYKAAEQELDRLRADVAEAHRELDEQYEVRLDRAHARVTQAWTRWQTALEAK